MSYYTLSLKDYYNSFGIGKTWEEKIKTASDKLFDFTFPWYNDNADGSLEDFKRFFYEKHFTDEIGFETIALFKMKMQEVFYRKIPYYSDMYKALHIEYDPLVNHDISGKNDVATTGKATGISDQTSDITNGGSDTHNTEHSGTIKNDGISTSENVNTHNESNNTSGTTTDSNKSKTQTIHSDFPQANFSTSSDYASTMDRAQSDTSNTSTTSSASGNDGGSTDKGKGSVVNTETFANSDLTTDKFGHTINTKVSSGTENNTNGTSNTTYSDSGWVSGSKTEELEKYRKAIRNLNEMLLHEFDDLFMGLLEPLRNDVWFSEIYGL